MSDERTIEPTPRRREQAWREGRFPRSRELAVGALLLWLLAFAHFAGDSWLHQEAISLREQLTHRAVIRADADQWVTAGRQSLAKACLTLWPWLAASLAVIVIAQLMQGGLVWLPARLSPDWSRLSPNRGPSVGSRLVQALWGVICFLAGITILVMGLWLLREPLCELGCHELREALPLAAHLLGKLLLPVVAACVALCGLEYGFRLRTYHASLKMTVADLRDEVRGRNKMPVTAADSGTERRTAAGMHPSSQRGAWREQGEPRSNDS